MKRALTAILGGARKAEWVMVEILGRTWRATASVPEDHAAKGELKNCFKMWADLRVGGLRAAERDRPRVVRAQASGLKAVPNEARASGPTNRGLFHFGLVCLWCDEAYALLSGIAPEFGRPSVPGEDSYRTNENIAPLCEELTSAQALAYGAAAFCEEFVRPTVLPTYGNLSCESLVVAD